MIITRIMYHCSMEEMVTLQYGSFAVLSEWAKGVTCPSGRNPGGGLFAGCDQTVLQNTPQDASVAHQDQPQSFHPRAPQGNRSVLTIPMTWVTHCHYPLTWPASYEMSLMSSLTIHTHLPPSATSSPQPPNNGSDQHHANPMGGAWLKTHTALSSNPMASGQAASRHKSTPDLTKHPMEWIQVHMAKNRQPPGWWWEFRSLYKGEVMGRLTNNILQQITRKQAVAFRLSAVQEEVAGLWEAPLNICSLSWQDFLPHCDFHGMRVLGETWKEGTLALAKVLQCGVERLGAPSGVLCNLVQDLQSCIEPLMCLEGDYIMETILLKASDNEPGISPTLAEEAALLGKDATPQEAQKTTTCPPDYLEEIPKPKGATELADPHDACVKKQNGNCTL